MTESDIDPSLNREQMDKTMLLDCPNCKQTTDQINVLKEKIKRQSLALDQLLTGKEPTGLTSAMSDIDPKKSPSALFDIKIQATDLKGNSQGNKEGRESKLGPPNDLFKCH